MMSDFSFGRPPLFDPLADALRAKHPLVFLEAASALAQASAPDPFAGTPLAQETGARLTAGS